VHVTTGCPAFVTLTVTAIPATAAPDLVLTTVLVNVTCPALIDAGPVVATEVIVSPAGVIVTLPLRYTAV
jgi:hypothetical protein